MDHPGAHPIAVGRSRLVGDLRALGVRTGAIAMVHTRMSAIGWVIGGSETVVRALLEALGSRGTLIAYASWEEHVYRAAEWPEEHRAATRAPGSRDLGWMSSAGSTTGGRDAHINSGMEAGLQDAMDLLEQVAVSLH